MARVKFVSKADWEIISKYLDEPGIVLLFCGCNPRTQKLCG